MRRAVDLDDVPTATPLGQFFMIPTFASQWDLAAAARLKNDEALRFVSATHGLPVEPPTEMTEEALAIEEPWLAISDELAKLRAEITSEVALSPDDPAPQASIAASDATEGEVSDDELLTDFVNEAQEHLELAEAQLLMLEEEPADQESLNAVFRAFHTIKGVANMLDLKAIGIVAHEAESLLDRARSGDLPMTSAVIDAALASCDALRKLVEAVGNGAPLARQAAEVDFAGLIARLRQLAGTDLGDPDEQAAFVAFSNGAEDEATEGTAGGAQSTAAGDTLKVDRVRLDELIDTIGDLAAAEAHLYQDALAAKNLADPAMEHLLELHRITRELLQRSASLRMMPLRATFQKMARLARDLSKKTDKPIDFHAVGEEIEVDKRIVDLVGDPLMHLIRNAIDHGIEGNLEDRLAAGKPFRGQLTVRAYRQASDVYIEVDDDGQGLNREKILAKARKLGLVDQDATLSDSEVHGLVFRAGFSTVDQVTDLSGRGVGMDVVKSNIEALGGSAELRSEPGRGTCFTLRLPLNLAIVDGVVVRVGRKPPSSGAAERQPQTP